MKPKTVASLIIGVLFVIVLIQNMEPVEFYMLFWRAGIPKLVLVLSSLLLGFGAGWFMRVAYARGRSHASPPREAVAEQPSQNVQSTEQAPSKADT